MTLARAQKSPRRDLSSTKLPGSQTRCVVTRAPWELMLCVEVVSALQLRARLASSTGSAKIVRASLRMPPLVPAVTSPGGDILSPFSSALSVRELFRQSGIYLKLQGEKEWRGARVKEWKTRRAGRVYGIEQFGKSNDFKMERSPGIGSTMPNDSHQRAAEFHELAAHAHRAAAAHHGKEDHQTGHEHSKQAMEYANKAFQWSQEAHGKSVKSAGKS